MGRLVVLLTCALVACYQPATKRCPTVDCPKDQVCDGQGGCAFPGQLSACDGKSDGDACSYTDPAGKPIDGACANHVCLPVGCGNGLVTPPEVCDDGNTANGDGCSADCLSLEVCGNGIVDPSKGEQCDDGNTIDGDGCQHDCTLPRCGDGVVDSSLQEACDAGAANSDAPDAPCRTTCQFPRCGDHVVDVAAGEVCDDGNNVSGDGCSGDCHSNETCGNGIVDSLVGEVCDDHNTVSGDGCAADCKSIEVCGNHVVDPGEVCDDGNTVSGDGCSSDCKSLEVCGNSIVDTINEQCDAGAANSNAPDAACRTNCKLPACGDGIKDTAHGEQCDNGANNADTADKCRTSCQLPRCGDGIQDTTEACDDGNATSGDGCSSDCHSRETCGNGIIDTAVGEQCDAGAANSNNPNAPCRADCKLPKCGDGIVDTASGESCDAGAANSMAPNAACRTNCQPQRCGDDVLDSGKGEVCDDGNTVAGDGCSSDCKSVETCGNGIVDTSKGEQCDNGAANANTPNTPCRTSCRPASCGDGILDNTLLDEGCDNGAANSNAPNAACRTTCQPRRCGDGIKDTATEVCDDGNTVAGDGCSPDCQSTEVCGNGIVDIVKGEQCDAAGANSNAPNAPCRTTCKLPKCGDGIVDTANGESCDAGAANSNAPDAACRTNCQPSRCGDGVLDTSHGEVCDDGNTTPDDGCSADCKSNETCGNGVVDTSKGEQCDAGAANSNAANAPCRTNCHLPSCGDSAVDTNLGETCDLGAANSNAPNATCRTNCRAQRCGDGIFDNTKGEVCDDGNTQPLDGCSADCKSDETCGNGIVDTSKGEQCDAAAANSNAPNAPCRPTCKLPKCGDSIVDTSFGETCDLGAANSNAANASCRINCAPQRCGDGILDNTKGEVCDDGNTASGDGCSADCASAETCGNGIVDVAKGEQCDAGGANSNAPNAPCRTNCKLPSCGDGVVDSAYGEGCDAAAANSNAPNAACRTNCQPQRCGDGVLDNTKGEVCDDSNVTGGDGCSADCKSNETCGNGIVDVSKGEQCDDGNASNADSCHTDCKIPKCGDGIVDATFNEQCDAGGANSNAPNSACRTTCVVPKCGDGIVDNLRGEVCDDGNATLGDGCRPDCASTEVCGNGILDPEMGEVCDDGNTRGRDGCSACEKEIGVVYTPNGAPPARDMSGLAYDAARQRIVMFGGYTPNGNLNDTWEWDGVSWIQQHPAHAPKGRLACAVAYDANRHRIVLFGGYEANFGLAQSDTWEYDGVDWTKITTATTPPARGEAAAAYDASRKRVVMYGGNDGTNPLADMWEWTGTTWNAIAATQPGTRQGHAMAADAKNKTIVLYGGGDAHTWTWSGAAWTDHGVSGGSGPTNHGIDQVAMVFDAEQQLIAAWDGTASSTYHWSGAAWTTIAGATPTTTRTRLTMAYDAIRKQTVLFGGCNGTLTTTCASGFGTDYADTWLRTGTAWAVPAAFVEPSARIRSAMVYDPMRKKIVLFGGQSKDRRQDCTSATCMLNDTWEWDGRKWTALAATTPPPVRAGHMLDYDPNARVIRLIAGDSATGSPPGNVFYNDVWTLNGSAWSSNPSAGRPATQIPTMVFDWTANRIISFGGVQPTTPFTSFQTTYAWSSASGAWTLLAPANKPPARHNSQAAYDPVRNRTVVFSGNPGTGQSLTDTWEWNNTTWTQVNSSGPADRIGANLFYNSDAERVSVFGDSGGLDGEDLWEFDGAAWTQRTLVGSIQSKYRTTVAYDAARREMLAFSGRTGGGSGGPTQGTVAIQYLPNATVEACTSAQVDYDNDGKFGCADEECWSVCTPLCPPGTTCAAGAPKCGDGVCSGPEDCNICPGDCGACVGKCGDFHCDSGETAATCPNDC